MKKRMMMPVRSTQGDYLVSAIGADDTSSPSSVTDLVDSNGAKMAGAAALAYHGYKRSSGSILWTVFYAAMGHWKPQYAVPVALAQGFGKKLTCKVDD